MSEESQVWANQVGAPMRLADGTVLTPGPQGYAVHNGKLYYPRNDGRGGYYVTNEGAAIGDPFQVYNADGSFSNNGVLTNAKFSDLAAMAALSAVGMGMFLPAMGAGGAAGGAAGAAGAGAGAGAGMTGAAFGDAGLMYAGADAAAAGGLGGGFMGGAGAASTAAASSGGLAGALSSLGGAGGWTSLIGPAASIGGALINAGAADSAAAKQAAATREANAILERQGAQIRADLAPYRQTGALANNRLAELLGLQNPGADGYGSLMKEFTLDDFKADPSYEFRRNEGMRGLENSAAARGNLLSGAAMKALTRYNSDLASQEYGNAYQRDAQNKATKYNFLAGSVSSGQNAAAQTGNYGMAVAQGVAGNTSANGNAQAAAGIAKSNALAGGITGAYGAYRQDQLAEQQLAWQRQQGEQMNALTRAVMGGNAGWSR